MTDVATTPTTPPAPEPAPDEQIAFDLAGGLFQATRHGADGTVTLQYAGRGGFHLEADHVERLLDFFAAGVDARRQAAEKKQAEAAAAPTPAQPSAPAGDLAAQVREIVGQELRAVLGDVFGKHTPPATLSATPPEPGTTAGTPPTADSSGSTQAPAAPAAPTGDPGAPRG